MLLTCLQENLVKGINIASRIVSSKNQLPILGNLLIKTEDGRLKISASNLETGINLYLGAKISNEGSFTIPAKILTEYVNSLPKDKVVLELKENLLNINCLSYCASFNGLPATEFPEIPSLKKAEAEIDSLVLTQAIKEVAFAAANDEGRPVLTGILLSFKTNQITLVATDGYRLSVKKIKNKEDFRDKIKDKTIIIPAKTFMELAKLPQEIKINEKSNKEKISLGLTEKGNQIIFHYQEVDLVTRLIDGQFPDYEKIIPRKFLTRITLSIEEFIKAVKVASIFARDSANIIKLKIENNQLIVSANAPQVGKNQTTMEVKQEGEDCQIAFNSRYLMDLLNNITGEEISLEMTNSLSPGVFRLIKDEDYLHIIMPVRVQEEENK